MEFTQELVRGKLIRRYKRFLADVELESGEQVTAHCTNSGSMHSCLEEGAPVCLSPVDNPRRKTPYTWEMIHINGDWVGINTSHPNALAYQWISEGRIPQLEGLEKLKREVRWGDSRFDIYGEEEDRACFVEVKNVSMKEGAFALFPDAVTERGRKHLHTLIKAKESGLRAVMLYVVQRMDVSRFAPARSVDPAYALSLEEAISAGVEAYVAQAKVSPEGIDLHRMLEVEL